MKPIQGYEGIYSITEEGAVFSHKRPQGSIGCGGKGGFLKPGTDKDGYQRVHLSKNGISKEHRIHNLVGLTFLGVPFVYHIDRNPANNNIQNLRPCTISQNRTNAKRNENNTSGFKGVNLRKNRGTWLARIQIDKKRIRLGSYKNKTDAALAYDKAAKKLFGDFAVLNFPDGKIPS